MKIKPGSLIDQKLKENEAYMMMTECEDVVFRSY